MMYLKIWLKLLGTCLFLAASTTVQAITFGPFGPAGEGGSINNHSFTIGAGGQVFELDAFLNISGIDLNDALLGNSAQLSLDPLPLGLDFTFTPSLSADMTDLTLNYKFSNNTGADIMGITFLSFLDVEIDLSFDNEFAETRGGLAAGQNFEVDEPGFSFGDIFENLLNGILDGTNALPEGSPEDVAMALSFDLGTLSANAMAGIDILISEDGDSIGGFAITQLDNDINSNTQITYSGAISSTTVVPEPATFFLFLLGLAGFGKEFLRPPSVKDR